MVCAVSPLCFVDCAGGGPLLINPQGNEDAELSSPVLAPKSQDPAEPDAEPVLNLQPEIRLRVLDFIIRIKTDILDV